MGQIKIKNEEKRAIHNNQILSVKQTILTKSIQASEFFVKISGSINNKILLK